MVVINVANIVIPEVASPSRMSQIWIDNFNALIVAVHHIGHGQDMEVSFANP